MIAKLATPDSDKLHRQFAAELRRAGFSGDVQLDFSSRLIQSTDNSIYQRLPEGVLYPANAEDLQRIARLSGQDEYSTLRFFPRGGGTGTNGQSLGDSFVVDLSRHMNRILEINVDERWARVEAGVVKDQLDAAVRAQGLFFAPDLSTSNRATIGGMINTDASGQGSCVYGKTRHHVQELELILSDGSRMRSRAVDEAELSRLCQRDDRIGKIYRQAKTIASECRDAVFEIFPPLNRNLTGYDLANLRSATGKLDLNALICGSEGTLGFVSEALLRLEPLPRYTGLLVIGYADFIAALRASRRLMAARPSAIECMDDVVVSLARSDSVWDSVSRFFAGSGHALRAVNFLEFSSDSEEEVAARMAQLQRELEADVDCGHLSLAQTRDPAEIAQLWTMRKRSVGLLGKMPGRERPLPFVEDSAVPPEQLADYIEAFRAVLEKEGLKYGMFGHCDAGVIHVRPALDLRRPDAMATVRRISDEVFALTRRFGGVLWGEHGKGLRSEYSPQTFGKLFPLLQQIKAAFDPGNRLNPGKIATPPTGGPLLRIDEVSTRGDADRRIPARVWDGFDDAVYCNGNGACFDWNPDQRMCPSWKVSRERKYSPKGRATLFKEWLARQAGEGKDILREGANQLYAGPPVALRSARAQAPADDFSHEVYDSMQACLACKACTTGCPIQVDVPAFRSVFFERYFQRYRRPLRHALIARLETVLPQVARFPAAYNFFSQSALLRPLRESLLGLSALPRMARSNPVERSIETPEPAALQALDDTERERSLILVQDVFTHFFEPDLVRDLCRFLQALGRRVWLAPLRPNGKAQHVLGYRQQFRQAAAANAAMLSELGGSGLPLVGLEPSMTLTYRDEYREIASSANLPRVQLLQEWLAGQPNLLARHRDRFNQGEFRLLPHCSEAALAGPSLKQWQSVFAALGSNLQVENVGCCGMAGTYGHESCNQDQSQRLFEMSWAGKLDRPNACATGFSCRSQAARFGPRRPPHPLQLLLRQLRAD